MAKKFQLILMIFCLGIFVVPKQIFFAENKEMSCCNKENSTKSCCDKEKPSPCKDSKTKHHSCDGNCSNCVFCSTSIVFLKVEFENKIEKFSQNNISNKVENFYLQPSLSDLPKKIWQPPKIS